MIGSKIIKLGDSFRGLWQLRELKAKRKRGHSRSCRSRTVYETNIRWYVTFRFKNEYIETPSKNTIEGALDYAINFLGL